jgi:hypothetical protein
VTLQSFCLAAVLLCSVAGALAQEGCPYLPEFEPLRKQLDTLSALDAVAALQKYVAEHDNPEGCELTEIDRLLGERDTALVKRVLGTREIPAQLVYRCNDFSTKTAQCQ